MEQPRTSCATVPLDIPSDCVDSSNTAGEITVRVRQADEQMIYFENVELRISTDERDSVIDPGYSSAPYGTGFGQANVHRLVEAHGWDITQTESETGGARFEFSGVELL